MFLEVDVGRNTRVVIIALACMLLQMAGPRHLVGEPEVTAVFVTSPASSIVSHERASRALIWKLKAKNATEQNPVYVGFELTHPSAVIKPLPKAFDLVDGSAQGIEGEHPAVLIKSADEVQLRVPVEFKEEGSFDGVLVVRKGTKGGSLIERKTYTVSFRAPALTLGSKTMDEVLAITTNKRAISRRLKVQTAAAGRVKITSVTFEDSMPNKPDQGERPGLRATLGDPTWVQRGVAVDVLLTGTVPKPGTYDLWAVITFEGGKRHQRVELKREGDADITAALEAAPEESIVAKETNRKTLSWKLKVQRASKDAPLRVAFEVSVRCRDLLEKPNAAPTSESEGPESVVGEKPHLLITAPGTYRITRTLTFKGAGTIEAKLVATQKGRSEPVLVKGYSIKFTPPVLHFEGHQADKPIALTVGGPVTNHHLKLAMAGEGKLRITGIAFQNVKTGFGAAATLEPTPALPRTMSHTEKIDVPLQVDVPSPGTYRGWVVFTFDGGERHQPIVVTLDGTKPVATIRHVYTGVFDTGERPHIGLTVKEVLDRPLTSNPPSLTARFRNLEGNAKADADFKLKRVLDQEGRVVSQVELAPLASKVLLLEIEKIDTPGTYSGSLQLHPKGGKPVDATYTFSVRRPWYVAGFWMLLGTLFVLLFNVIRYTVMPGIKRDIDLRKLAERVDELAGEVKSPDERDAFDTLRVAYRALARLAADREATGFTSARKILLVKLDAWPRWVDANRLFAAAPEPAQTDTSEALGKLRDFFDNAAPTDTELAAATSGANSLPTTIGRAIKKHYADEGKKLAAEIKAIKLPPEGEAKKAAEALLILARADLDLVRKHAQSGRYGEAATAFDRLRKHTALLHTVDLRGRLEQEVRPTWFAEADWKTMREGIAASLDDLESEDEPEDILARYRVILKGYVRTLMEKLQPQVVLIEKWLEEWEGLSEKTKAAIDAATVAFDLAQTAQKNGKPEEALTAYDESAASVRNAYKAAAASKALQFLKMRGGLPDPEIRVTPTRLSPPGAYDALRVPDATTSKRKPSEKTIEQALWKLRFLEAVLWLVPALVAVAMGLTTQWGNDPDWGTMSDILVAVGWGLGISGTVQAGAAGIGAVRDKMTGTKSIFS